MPCVNDFSVYFKGSDHAAFPAYILRSWAVLSQVAIGALSSLLIWFMGLALPVMCQTVLGDTGIKSGWHQVSASSPSFISQMAIRLIRCLLAWLVMLGGWLNRGLHSCNNRSVPSQSRQMATIFQYHVHFRVSLLPRRMQSHSDYDNKSCHGTHGTWSWIYSRPHLRYRSSCSTSTRYGARDRASVWMP